MNSRTKEIKKKLNGRALDAWEQLVQNAELNNLFNLSVPVLLSESFITWTGSNYREDGQKHHYGLHGLLIHTADVWGLVDSIAQHYKPQIAWAATCSPECNIESIEIDRKVLFLASLYHDIGKTYDYEKDWDDKWRGTKHKDMFHHITRSVLIWEKVAEKQNVDEKLKDHVTHCILSHHGKREWGSPVHPQTPEAWILHFSDSISARVDESFNGINKGM